MQPSIEPKPSAALSRSLDRRARTLVLAAAVAAALACEARAQRQFEVMGKRALPFDAFSNSSAVVFGDLDADGDLDAVVGRNGQTPVLLRNNGSGEYVDESSGRMPAVVPSTLALALGDIDADGDLDLVLGNMLDPCKLYTNDGTGRFVDASAAGLPPNLRTTTAVALCDIDGDGDLDLLLGRFGPQSLLLTNDGLGHFVDATASRMPTLATTVNALATGDVDGDGDLDLVVGTSEFLTTGGSHACHLLRNNSGVFVEVSATTLPAISQMCLALALGDVDGDGDLDLVLGNSNQQNPAFVFPQDRLYLNDGTGTFTDVTASRMPVDDERSTAVTLFDMDGDGDLDLAIGSKKFDQAGFGIGRQNRLYQNLGNGTFQDDTALLLPAFTDQTAALAVGDIDADGDLDLLVANDGQTRQDRLLVNDGSGAFADAAGPRVRGRFRRYYVVASGDIDGDLDQDLLLGSWAGESVLLRNDGRGDFEDITPTSLPPLPDDILAFAFADFDGDGDLDVVSAGQSQQCRMLLGNGAGQFTDGTVGRLPVAVTTTLALAVGDFDGDGDIDLVLGNSGPAGAQSRLYLNDGTGVFVDATTQLPTATQATAALAAADFDGDGDIDLAVGVTGSYFGPGAQNHLWLNNGNATFTDASAGQLPAFVDHTVALAAGDVDGDGDIDLVVGNTNTYYFAEQNRLYLNDGTGTFTVTTGLPALTGYTASLALADGDGDGDLDLLVGRGGNQAGGASQDQYLTNDGTGQFVDATGLTSLAAMATSSVALTDLDRDGDADMVVARMTTTASGRGGTTFEVFTNLLRQLDAPNLLVLGRPYRLDAYARVGPPNTNDLVLPFFTPIEANFVLPPLGIVGIDPGSAVALPGVVIPRPAGVATLTIQVPFIPSLAGIPVHFQAIHASTTLPNHVTNVVTDTIRR